MKIILKCRTNSRVSYHHRRMIIEKIRTFQLKPEGNNSIMKQEGKTTWQLRSCYCWEFILFHCKFNAIVCRQLWSGFFGEAVESWSGKWSKNAREVGTWTGKMEHNSMVHIKLLTMYAKAGTTHLRSKCLSARWIVCLLAYEKNWLWSTRNAKGLPEDILVLFCSFSFIQRSCQNDEGMLAALLCSSFI